MKRQVLFFQGGGNDGFIVDKALAASLQEHLGNDYSVMYQEIKTNESLPDYGWTNEIEKQLAGMDNGFILAGHSFGASMILKYLSEHSIAKNINGIFLLATPFWEGEEEWKKPFKLKDDFAAHLPAQTPIFFYHCKDDEEVPFGQYRIYKRKLPNATYRELHKGGHQFNNDLSKVAEDMKRLGSN